MYLGDRANQTEPVPVDQFGLEHAIGDGGGAGSGFAQGLYQAQILALKYFSRDFENRGRSDTQSVHSPRFDPFCLERKVELRPTAMDDDRRQPDLLQECERRTEPAELGMQCGAADFDDGEFLALDTGKSTQVLLDFLLATEVSE